MTIITNPLASLVKKGLIIGGFNANKKNKLDEPLVDNAINEKNAEKKIPKVDVEGALLSRHYYVLHSHARRVSASTTVCVFLTALLVTTLGIVGGVYLFNQVAKSQVHRFRGWCKIPKPTFSFLPDHPSHGDPTYQISSITKKTDWVRRNNQIDAQSSGPFPESFFKEEFEIDDVNNYQKIEVSNFGRGRRGRFIHDFAVNKTGIVDIDNRRCFVMSLDRETVIPPLSLTDLVKKLQQRYYEVDTRIVRTTMHIVVPAIKDYSQVGFYISQECSGIPTYLLKKISNPIKKRSIETSDDDAMHFMEFAGKGIQDIELVNMEVLE